jgi:serine/threonine-protein kinase
VSDAAQATIFVPVQDTGPAAPASAAPGANQTGTTPVPAFDAEMLRKLTAALAAHVGPIAGTVVKAAARKTTALRQLVEKVAAEIADEKARAAFVKAHLPEEKSAPTGAPVVSSRSPPAHPDSMPLRFDPATLAKAETELAKYIGAVARVVVRRAAAKARDEAELYLLLADQIEDKEQKKAFVRKAMSVSGRE